MMEKLRALSWFQRAVLILMAVMTVVFLPIYAITVSREGFLYQDALLMPSVQKGDTVYAGKLKGEAASFTVSVEKTVVFRWGEQTYGPYVCKEDPTAVPKEVDFADAMTGVELWCGEELVFRGGVAHLSDTLLAMKEDGTMGGIGGSWVAGGLEIDEYGAPKDPMKPKVTTILTLMDGPELTHKGDWGAWFGGALMCAMTAVSILYADELFRWNLSFLIRDAHRAEPSDWELSVRELSWTVMPILALIVFVVGLQ